MSNVALSSTSTTASPAAAADTFCSGDGGVGGASSTNTTAATTAATNPPATTTTTAATATSIMVGDYHHHPQDDDGDDDGQNGNIVIEVVDDVGGGGGGDHHSKNGDERTLLSPSPPAAAAAINGDGAVDVDDNEENDDDEDAVIKREDDRAVLSYKEHLYDSIQITIPIILSEIFQNTLPLIDLGFVGSLSKIDLGSAALATVWFNLWNSTMLGFLTATDTYLGQCYGSGKYYKEFRQWTGTSIILGVILTCIMSIIISLCEPIMIWFGQSTILATNAGDFSLRLIPGLFPYYIFKILIKYLQTQNYVLPGVIIGILANILNIIFNYIFIYEPLHMGLLGAPWATTLTRYVELILLVVYLQFYWSRKHQLQQQQHQRNDNDGDGSGDDNNNNNTLSSPSTWPIIISKEYITNRNIIIPFLKIACNGALSLTAEAWSFEITTILAGLLGTVSLDAHVVTLTVATFLFLSFPFSIGIMVSIRVSQYIGNSQYINAQRISRVAVILAAIVQGILIIILLPLNDHVGYWFASFNNPSSSSSASASNTIDDVGTTHDNNNDDVAHLVSQLIPISCVFMMGDSIQATVGGVLRGLGRQKLVLLLNILGFWILAVPIGSLLTFQKSIHLGVHGLWWGMVIGIYSSAILGIVLIKYRVNWSKEVEKSLRRISTRETTSATTAAEVATTTTAT